MPEFFDYDPLSGVRKTFDYDESTGTAFIRSEQDVSPVLDMALENRNTGKFDGFRKEFKMYASLPPVVQIQLRQKGIDIYSKDPAMIRRMLREINTNYPYLKSTYKTHE